MLSSAVKDVLDLFHEILLTMMSNGMLKTFLFTYEENDLFVLDEQQFLINASHILDELKKVLHKFYTEVCKQTFLAEDLDLFTLNPGSVDSAAYNSTMPNIDNFSILNGRVNDLFEFGNNNLVDDIDALDEPLAINSVSLLETSAHNDTCWLNNISTTEERQNAVSLLNSDFENNSNEKFNFDKKNSSAPDERNICDRIITELNKNDLCNRLLNDSYDSITENNNDLFGAGNNNGYVYTLLNEQLLLEERLNDDQTNRPITEYNCSTILPKSAEELLIVHDDPSNNFETDKNLPTDIDSSSEQMLFDRTVNHTQFTQETSNDNFIAENQNDRLAESPSSDKENMENRLPVDDITNGSFSKYQCKECDKAFPTRIKLNLHIESHGPLQFACTVCGKKFGSQQFLNAHKKIHKTNSVSCFKCNLTFKNRSKLVHHLKVSHSGVRLPCAVKGCNKTFTSYSSMWQHVKWSHNSFKKLKCQICGRELARRDSLNRHLLMVHSITSSEGIKPYRCSLCKRSFATKLNYKQHLETHVQGHSKYPCSSCGQLFSHPDILKRHMKIHVARTGYACAICGRTFTIKRNLINHQLKHNQDDSSANQIECEICGKRFKSLATLSFHTKMHEGKFMFKCHVCDKEFVRRCHYNDHMLCHSDIRPYKCPVCPSSFKSAKYLRGHGRRLHKHLPDYKSLFESVLSGTETDAKDDEDATAATISVVDSSNSEDSNAETICNGDVFINSDDKFDDLSNISLNINYVDDISLNDISLCQMQFDLIY